MLALLLMESGTESHLAYTRSQQSLREDALSLIRFFSRLTLFARPKDRERRPDGRTDGSRRDQSGVHGGEKASLITSSYCQPSTVLAGKKMVFGSTRNYHHPPTQSLQPMNSLPISPGPSPPLTYLTMSQETPRLPIITL